MDRRCRRRICPGLLRRRQNGDAQGQDLDDIPLCPEKRVLCRSRFCHVVFRFPAIQLSTARSFATISQSILADTVLSELSNDFVGVLDGRILNRSPGASKSQIHRKYAPTNGVPASSSAAAATSAA